MQPTEKIFKFTSMMYGRYHIPEIESVKFFPQKNFALKVGRGGAGGAPGDMHVEK
jgi:hypothetical protein